jgi:hypothetical protein
MIRFTLTCAQDHSFESWFASNAACDKLMSAGMVGCTTCGSTEIRKTLMAPAVGKKGGITAPPTQIEKMRKEVEANSEYVGGSFATQARDMHDGMIPEKAIYGEANGAEARALIEDGIPVIPLPFMPTKKVN